MKLGGVKKNPKGFFEDTNRLDANHRVHKAFGLRASGANVRLVEERAWRTTDLETLHDQTVAIIERHFADDRPFGLKSGRLLRLMPFWERVFESAGITPGYVMALRNPLGVADSRANLDMFHGYRNKSDLEWLVQVLPYIDRLRGQPRLYRLRLSGGRAVQGRHRRLGVIGDKKGNDTTRLLRCHPGALDDLDARLCIPLRLINVVAIRSTISRPGRCAPAIPWPRPRAVFSPTRARWTRSDTTVRAR